MRRDIQIYPLYPPTSPYYFDFMAPELSARPVTLSTVLISIATSPAIRCGIEQRIVQDELWRWIKRNTYDLIKLSYIGRPIKSNVLFERWQPDSDGMVIQGVYHGCQPRIYIPQKISHAPHATIVSRVPNPYFRSADITRELSWLAKYTCILNYSRQHPVNFAHNRPTRYSRFLTERWKIGHWEHECTYSRVVWRKARRILRGKQSGLTVTRLEICVLWIEKFSRGESYFLC